MSQTTGVNKVILLGETVSDTFTSEVFGNESYLLFTFVTKEVIKRGSGTFEHTECHNVKVPQKLLSAEHITITAGQTLYLEGKLQTTNFVDRENIRRYDLDVVVSRIELMA